jgi:hypothetical protein
VTADNTSLTFTALDGQVVTFTGNFTNTTFAGIYSINGGCAAGDQGRVIGTNIPYIANQLSGTFTNSAHETFNVAGDIAQSGSAGSEGSFEITGSVTFDSPCFNAGTVRPERFPRAVSFSACLWPSKLRPSSQDQIRLKAAQTRPVDRL